MGVAVGTGSGLSTASYGVTVKFVAVDTLPLEVVTVIGPVIAPDGTVTVIFVEVKLPEAEAFPAKTTESGGMKLVPRERYYLTL